MGPGIFEKSKAAIFLAGLYGRLRSIMGNSAVSGRLADLSLEIKRGFLDKPVKSASIFAFTAVSVNILLSAAAHLETGRLDIIIKGAVLLLSLAGFFCNSNWKDVKKSSVILSNILK